MKRYKFRVNPQVIIEFEADSLTKAKEIARAHRKSYKEERSLHKREKRIEVTI